MTHLLKYGGVEFYLEWKSTFLTNAVSGQKCNDTLSTLVQEFEDKCCVI